MNCAIKGKSGEKGCMQYMPNTWIAHSKKVLGYVAPLTPTNEKFVATHIISKLLEKHTPVEVALIWNGGEVKYKSGVNAHGVAYNTKLYADKVMKYYQQ